MHLKGSGYVANGDIGRDWLDSANITEGQERQKGFGKGREKKAIKPRRSASPKRPQVKAN